MVLFYIVSGALTVAVSTVGDLILVHCSMPWLRAVADNVTHGLVGLLCWMMVSGKPLQATNLQDSVLGGLFACAVDVDHFLAAGSFSIEDATNLKTRPFLHCSSVVLASLSASALAGRLCGHAQVYKVALIALVAVASHHLRDSIRRGLWLWPFGSTSPLKLYMYYLGLACTVLLAALAMKLEPQAPTTTHVPLVRFV